MSKAPKHPAAASGHVARLRGGSQGSADGKASANKPGNRDTPAGKAVTRPEPRPLKELAGEFGRVAKELRAEKIDVATARLILRAMQNELRCLETQLRFGAVVLKAAWEK